MLSAQERQQFDARIAQIRSIEPSGVLPIAERYRRDLSRVIVGGVLAYADHTYRVTGSAVYTEVTKGWKKKTGSPYIVTELTLFCLEDGTTRYIEWSRDDDLEICFTERKIPRSELKGRLKYGNGEFVDISDIDEICDEEETLFFDRRAYPYDDDEDMVFESADGRHHYVSLADFGRERDGRWLTVEAWTDTPRDDESWEYEVWLSHDVSPAAISVLVTGET